MKIEIIDKVEESKEFKNGDLLELIDKSGDVYLIFCEKGIDGEFSAFCLKHSNPSLEGTFISRGWDMSSFKKMENSLKVKLSNK